MNRLWSLIVILLLLTSCEDAGSKRLSTDLVVNSKSASGEAGQTETPRIKFEHIEHNFGRIIQGERVLYRFKFTNTGQAGLLINDVSTSCGCTVGKYPHTVVEPGDSDYIEVTFDSSNRRGMQNKTITVLTNSQPNITTLRIKAEIVMPEKN